jgi:low molecular weight protein-tyrosine phosphatase
MDRASRVRELPPQLIEREAHYKSPSQHMPKQNAKKSRRILFLCTGNYYRSRFAELFFNWQAQQRGLAWQAESRGLAIDGYNYGPISRHTLATLSAHGIPTDDPRFPLPLTEADLTDADMVVAVKEAEHRPLVEMNFPKWRDRIEYWHVHDLDCAPPDEAIPHLEREVERLLDRLAA